MNDQLIAHLTSEITAERSSHNRLMEAVDSLLLEAEAIERQLDFLIVAKEQSRRELARLRKAKSRVVTGRN